MAKIIVQESFEPDSPRRILCESYELLEFSSVEILDKFIKEHSLRILNHPKSNRLRKNHTRERSSWAEVFRSDHETTAKKMATEGDEVTPPSKRIKLNELALTPPSSDPESSKPAIMDSDVIAHSEASSSRIQDLEREKEQLLQRNHEFQELVDKQNAEMGNTRSSLNEKVEDERRQSSQLAKRQDELEEIRQENIHLLETLNTLRQSFEDKSNLCEGLTLKEKEREKLLHEKVEENENLLRKEAKSAQEIRAFHLKIAYLEEMKKNVEAQVEKGGEVQARKEAEVLRAENSKLKSRLEFLSAEFEKVVKHRVPLCKAPVASKETQVDELTAVVSTDASRNNTETVALRSELDKANTSNAELIASESEDKLAQYEERMMRYNRLKKKHEHLQGIYTTAKQQMQQLITENEELKSLISGQQGELNQLEALKQEKDTLENEYTVVQENLQESEKKVVMCQKENEDNSKEIEQLVQEVEQLKSDVASRDSEIETLKSNEEKSNAVTAEIENLCSNVVEYLKNAEKEKKSTHEELKIVHSLVEFLGIEMDARLENGFRGVQPECVVQVAEAPKEESNEEARPAETTKQPSAAPIPLPVEPSQTRPLKIKRRSPLLHSPLPPKQPPCQTLLLPPKQLPRQSSSHPLTQPPCQSSPLPPQQPPCQSSPLPLKQPPCQSSPLPPKQPPCQSSSHPLTQLPCQSSLLPMKQPPCQSSSHPLTQLPCQSSLLPLKQPPCQSSPLPLKQPPCQSQSQSSSHPLTHPPCQSSSHPLKQPPCQSSSHPLKQLPCQSSPLPPKQLPSQSLPISSPQPPLPASPPPKLPPPPTSPPPPLPPAKQAIPQQKQQNQQNQQPHYRAVAVRMGGGISPDLRQVNDRLQAHYPAQLGANHNTTHKPFQKVVPFIRDKVAGFQHPMDEMLVEKNFHAPENNMNQGDRVYHFYQQQHWPHQYYDGVYHGNYPSHFAPISGDRPFFPYHMQIPPQQPNHFRPGMRPPFIQQNVYYGNEDERGPTDSNRLGRGRRNNPTELFRVKNEAMEQLDSQLDQYMSAAPSDLL